MSDHFDCFHLFVCAVTSITAFILWDLSAGWLEFAGAGFESSSWPTVQTHKTQIERSEAMFYRAFDHHSDTR